MKINQALLDEVTRIKVNILRRHGNDNLKSILATSANSGEGTSTLAANLALAFGMGGRSRILLVDANFRNPSLHDQFNMDQEKGFADFLKQEAALPEIIRDTSVANVKLITAGTIAPTESKLNILSGNTQAVKESLEKDFDWVIYDSAPLNSYPDTLLITPFADGVVLVILAEQTRRAAVQRVKESLDSINANILGGVLNGRQYVVPRFIYKRL